MVKRSRCATASFAVRTTSSAAAANNSCGVVSIRISTEALTGLRSTLCLVLVASDGSTACRSQQSSFIIGDDLHRNRFHQRAHAALIEEGLHKYRARQLGKDLGRDASGQEQASGGHHLQRQIGSLRAVNGDPYIQCFLRQTLSSIERSARNYRGRIALLERIGKLRRFLPASAVAQEFVNIHQSGAGKDALVADVPEARFQEPYQLDLQFSLRTKVGVPAFACENMVPASVPEKPGLS